MSQLLGILKPCSHALIYSRYANFFTYIYMYAKTSPMLHINMSRITFGLNSALVLYLETTTDYCQEQKYEFTSFYAFRARETFFYILHGDMDAFVHYYIVIKCV